MVAVMPDLSLPIHPFLKQQYLMRNGEKWDASSGEHRTNFAPCRDPESVTSE
jgi:hypothetical protein